MSKVHQHSYSLDISICSKRMPQIGLDGQRDCPTPIGLETQLRLIKPRRDGSECRVLEAIRYP